MNEIKSIQSDLYLFHYFLSEGDELAVVLTLSAIEDMIATFQEQSRMSLGDLTDITTNSSLQDGYSDQTSHRLDDTVRGMSDKVGNFYNLVCVLNILYDILYLNVVSWSNLAQANGLTGVNTGFGMSLFSLI